MYLTVGLLTMLRQVYGIQSSVNSFVTSLCEQIPLETIRAMSSISSVQKLAFSQFY